VQLLGYLSLSPLCSLTLALSLPIKDLDKVKVKACYHRNVLHAYKRQKQSPSFVLISLKHKAKDKEVKKNVG